MKILRWLLVLPVAVIGWYLGLIVALLLHATGEHLCPAEEIVSGYCTAPWMAYVDDFALVLGSLLCGALVVVFPTLVAPLHRGTVAVIAFVSALVVSAPFLIHGMWVPVAWATLAGGLMLWRIRIVLARS
jgi:hypothetical protein